MRKFKVGLRTMLLLIALIALGLWADGMRQRAVFCLAAAARNEKVAAQYLNLKQVADAGTVGYDKPGEAAFYGRVYHKSAKTAQDYRHAAYRPWVSLPQEPEMFEGWINDAPQWRGLSVIKIIHSAPIRIIDRILLPQLCHLRIGVPSVQGLARR